MLGAHDPDFPQLMMRLLLALWATLILLHSDKRRATLPFKVALSVLIVLAHLFTFLVVSSFSNLPLTFEAMANVIDVARYGSMFAAVVVVGVLFRLWTSRSKATEQSTKAPQKSEHLILVCLLFGISCITTTLIVLGVDFPPNSSPNAIERFHAYSMLHLLTSTAMWSIATVTAMQLTFLSSPSDFTAVEDKRVGKRRRRTKDRDYAPHPHLLTWAASILVVLELFALGAILTTPIPNAPEALETRALAWAFAGTILVAYFVSLMIAVRIAHFHRAKVVSQWTSLTLASWIASLTLAVACSLPPAWPWSSL